MSVELEDRWTEAPLEQQATPPSEARLIAQLKLLEAERDSLRRRLHLSETSSRDRREADALGLSSRQLAELAAPWRMYLDWLRGYLSAGRPEALAGLQTITEPRRANWHVCDTGPYNTYLLASTVPAWGAAFVPSHRRLDAAYRQLLTTMELPGLDAETRARAIAARDAWRDRLEELDAHARHTSDAWQAFDRRQLHVAADQRLTFEAWFERFAAETQATLQEAVDAAAEAYGAFVAMAYPGRDWAPGLIQQYRDQGQWYALFDAAHTMHQVPNFEIAPDLERWIDGSRNSSAASPLISTTLDRKSSQSRYEQSRWGGTGSLAIGWFSFGTGDDTTRMAFDASHPDFEMQIHAANIAPFEIEPGSWWNGAALGVLRDSAAAMALEHGVEDPQAAFGPGGGLSQMVRRLIVALRPRVTMRLAEADYKRVKEQAQVHGDMGVGPFGFGGYGDELGDEVEFDDRSRTITAEDRSDVPQIIAVDTVVLPTFR